MYQVLKRDGKIVDFNLTKINDAIKMAFEAQEKQYHPSVIDFLALKVTADFEPKIKEGVISVEDIQDSVEAVLVQAGYADVAKAYILYRKQREKLRIKGSQTDHHSLHGSGVVVAFRGHKPDDGFTQSRDLRLSEWVFVLIHSLSYSRGNNPVSGMAV